MVKNNIKLSQMPLCVHKLFIIVSQNLTATLWLNRKIKNYYCLIIKVFEVLMKKNRFLDCPHNVENVLSMNKLLPQYCGSQVFIHMESSFAGNIRNKLHINLQKLLKENRYITYKGK